MKRCPTCKHEEHKPGCCRNDNCGASEISHSDAIGKHDRTRVVTQQNFTTGTVSVVEITRIRSRNLGDRN
jgi:hypothetical protein